MISREAGAGPGEIFAFRARIAVRGTPILRRFALIFLALPILTFGKDSWSSGSIKVLDTNEWCARPGIPDWPEICGPPRADATTLFSDSHGGGPPSSPYSQILEIDGVDAIYVIRRTSLDGGLQFREGARAQFLVDGKHLIVKFDRETANRRGEAQVKHERARTDILEVRKR